MPATKTAVPALGVGLYLLGVFFFAVNDALGKWLVVDYGVGQLMMLRSVGAAIVLAPMVAVMRVDMRDTNQWPLQGLRILCTAADTFSFYWSTRSMPLADVMTFYMAAPLLVTAMSAPLLGEKVERFRWIAVGVGFIGVLIALRPTPQMFSLAAPVALFGATMFALGQTVTRKLRRTHWLPLVGWQFIGCGIIGGATIPFSWVTPGYVDLGLMFVVGVVSMLCFICITKALAITRAATLAPLQYTMIVWATIMGWLVWRDVPTWPTILGNAIIIGSGLFVAAWGVRSKA